MKFTKVAQEPKVRFITKAKSEKYTYTLCDTMRLNIFNRDF